MKIKKILKDLREVEVFVVATSNQEAIAKIKEAIVLIETGTPKQKAPATGTPAQPIGTPDTARVG